MPRAPVHLAVLSVTDASGDVTMENIVADHATAAGHRITAFDSVRDTEIAIRAQLHGWIADPDIDVVIVVGDATHTSRALAPFVEEALPGFADLLRLLAFQEIGASAMLSTAEAARCGSTYVFVLPAHPAAVRTAMDKLILPQLDPQTQPRNLISSIPRLQDATSVDTPRAPTVAAAPPANVPIMIPTEKTATGTGASPRKPAAVERVRARTGAHVVVRKVEDPTKPIELQKLEHQLELSKTGDEVTKQTPLVAAPPSAPRREPTRPPVVTPATATPRPRARVSQPTPFRASPTVPRPAPTATAAGPATPAARTAAPGAPMPTPAGTARPAARPVAPSAPPSPARVAQPTPPVPTSVRLPARPSSPPVERARPPTAPPATPERARPPTAPPAPRVRAPTPPVPVRAPTPPPPAVEDDAAMLSASDLEEVPIAATPAPLPAPTPAPATFELARDAMFEAPSLRKSRVPMVIGLLVLAAAIGAGLVLWLAPRDRAPRAVRDEAAVAPVTFDAAVIVASVEVDAAPAAVEPEIEMPPPDAASAPPAPAPTRTPAPRARATAASRPAAAAASTATPATPDAPTAPPVEAAAKPVAPADPDCEEVACVLEKYARPCCARYKPAAPSFQPTVGTGETLDRAQIRAGMNTVRALVITCAERFPVKGTVKLAVTVGADGGVQDVSVDAAPSDELGGCAAAAAKKARFAKTASGGAFTYPFVF